jgi:hypothetical protein
MRVPRWPPASADDESRRPTVLVMRGVRTVLLLLGQIVIGSLGVISTVAATHSDDAQAGFWFAYPLLFASTAAGVLVVLDGRLRRGPELIGSHPLHACSSTPGRDERIRPTSSRRREGDGRSRCCPASRGFRGPRNRPAARSRHRSGHALPSPCLGPRSGCQRSPNRRGGGGTSGATHPDFDG